MSNGVLNETVMYKGGDSFRPGAQICSESILSDSSLAPCLSHEIHHTRTD